MKVLKYKINRFLSVAVVVLAINGCAVQKTKLDIQPYQKNKAYWQYKGKPVLLLGGSNNDNLFQSSNLKEHLDEMASVGANFIRNTMSYRDSTDVTPYKLGDDGKYDLDQWNNEFWERFNNLLKWSNELDIIIQIEVWDRFDFSRQPWKKNPFNPTNNINYTEQDIPFEADYPKHPSKDLQPFFHSLPGMPLYKQKLDHIRAYQEKFVEKMLSYSLQYNNVLYCMNNETTTPVQWGNYWIKFINDKAASKGRKVYQTDMYDLFYKVNDCERCKELIAKPSLYDFIDISQINSRNFGRAHWDTLQSIVKIRNRYPLRPINHVKIYGGGHSNYGSGSNNDGIERFVRNVVGGSAAVRHHRPMTGNGLNNKSKASIKAIRKVEQIVPFWILTPQLELLTNNEPNEAYLTCKWGKAFVVYFPNEGDVSVEVDDIVKEYEITWISLFDAEVNTQIKRRVSQYLSLVTPDDKGCLAVIVPIEKIKSKADD